MSKKDKKEKVDISPEKEEAIKSSERREPYRNWFLLLGVISGIAVGLAVGSILVNQDSEKTYISSKEELSVAQSNLSERVSLLEKELDQREKKLYEVIKKTQDNTKSNLAEGLERERAYVDEKRIRIWREIDLINGKIKVLTEEVNDLQDQVNQSKD